MNYLKSSLVEAGAEAVAAGVGVGARETAGVRVGARVPLPLLGAPASSFSPVGGVCNENYGNYVTRPSDWLEGLF